MSGGCYRKCPPGIFIKLNLIQGDKNMKKLTEIEQQIEQKQVQLNEALKYLTDIQATLAKQSVITMQLIQETYKLQNEDPNNIKPYLDEVQKYAKALVEANKEKEKLLVENSTLKAQNHALENRVQDLTKENEKLKNQIQALTSNDQIFKKDYKDSNKALVDSGLSGITTKTPTNSVVEPEQQLSAAPTLQANNHHYL